MQQRPAKQHLPEYDPGVVTAQLRAVVDCQAPIASDADVARQRTALNRFTQLFTHWLQSSLGLAAVVPSAMFHVFASGSYRLGVASADTDVDLVFVTTRRVTRADVFGSFVALLGATPGVTQLQPVPTARVPLIGLCLDGQELDVMVCHLLDEVLPPRSTLLRTYDWMNQLDDGSILAFTGPRVTEHLLAAVPKGAFASFVLALRLLRLWAKRRGVYSNRAGYFGGINLALMLVWVVQKWAAGASVGAAADVGDTLAPLFVARVFRTFAQWRWGYHNPVALAGDASAGAGAGAGAGDAAALLAQHVHLQHLEWRADTAPRTEVMVMLTPCIPRFNSLFSANKHTMRTMATELAAALGVVAASATPDWAALVTPLDLFATCTRFLRVGITAPKTVAGAAWQGFVESQTRHLVALLGDQPLNIKQFRHVPVWVTEEEGEQEAGGATVVRATFIAADVASDMVAMRGNVLVPTQHFSTAYARNGPAWPSGARIDVTFVSSQELPAELRPPQLPTPAAAAPEVSLPLPPAPVVLPAVAAVGHHSSVDKEETAAPAMWHLGIAWPRRDRVCYVRNDQDATVAGQRLRVVGCSAAALSRRHTTTVVCLRRRDGVVVQGCDVYVGPPWFRGGWQLQASPWSLPGRPPCSTPTYTAWLKGRLAVDPAFYSATLWLRGKVLGCWCAHDNPNCHARQLSALVDSAMPPPPPPLLPPPPPVVSRMRTGRGRATNKRR